ncbi:MAG: oxidoreductase [Gammaproteobacteria bacterium]|nr:oxidoreductase [Gammaproteobacteria bacterium]
MAVERNGNEIDKKNIAFIGLGVMGYPMAGHLSRSGFNVRVYNRTEQRAKTWVTEFGGDYAMTPKEAASDCDIVFVCVGNDDDVRAVVLGDSGALAGMNKGGVLVDHTTASAGLARELSKKSASLTIGFLDAPVSGGQAGAENGALTVMVGGEPAVFKIVQPFMESYASYSNLLGQAGSGQLAKMANQICIAGVIEGLAEALSFARRAGLDGIELIETISKGAAGSWQMLNRHETMLDGKYDFGFAVDWMRKDLNIALEEAALNGSQLPLVEMVDRFYSEIQEKGGGRMDTSSLLTRYD